MSYKEANPLIWGAIGAVIAATIIVLSQLVGSHIPPNPWLATAGSAAGGGFLLGAGIAAARNWWNTR